MKEGAKSELLIEPEWATTAPSEPVPDEKLQVKLELVNWDEVTDVSKDGGVLLRSAPDGSPGAGEGWAGPGQDAGPVELESVIAIYCIVELRKPILGYIKSDQGSDGH